MKRKILAMILALTMAGNAAGRMSEQLRRHAE